jgi:hypothetical protein
MSDFAASPGSVPKGTPRPDPVRRRGEPFFDQLVEDRYSPAKVRQALYRLLKEQYAEADRISGLRGWGGPQPHGNDRYQYSLEQGPRLSSLLLGAELLRPSQSLLYGVAGALIYPMRYGNHEDDCLTSAQIDEDSDIQAQLAEGCFNEPPTLFDPDPEKPRTVVWLLFTGNHVEGGPLSAYLAQPGGRLPERHVEWTGIEPLITHAADDGPEDGGAGGSGPVAPAAPMAPEPTLNLQLRR